MKLVFYGMGGHFKVAYNIAILNGYTDIIVYDEKIDGFKWQQLVDNHRPSFHYFCSIGDNETRFKMTDSVKFNWTNLIHPSAVLSNLKMGVGNIICAGAIIEPDTVIGDHCIINTNSSINHDCVLENYVHIGPGSTLCGSVIVGQKTLIGAGSTIIPKITIGKNCIIGAGSIIVRDIPDNIKAYGNPLKISIQ